MKCKMYAHMLFVAGWLFGMGLLPAAAMLNDPSDGRMIESLSEWQFVQDTSPEGSEIVLPGKNAEWTVLEIPHCFRLSGLREKSAGFYRRSFTPAADDANKCFYLFLEGAGAVVDVFVNGALIGQHKGAYTAAWIDLTPGLKFGMKNELIVRVTNRDKEAANCLSQSVLYYTNGGLYRPVWLVTTQGVHIFPDMGSAGVYLTPKNITESNADLEVAAHVRNTLEKAAQVVVRNTITDPDGNQVAQFDIKSTIPSGTVRAVTGKTAISDPVLWTVHKGNLYTVYTEILVDGKVTDAITERTGIRTIAMQDGHFMLNGKKLLVRGVCKHHMDEHVWNAMTDEQLKWEIDQVAELGCNSVRLAHYPHRRLEYQLTDEAGMVVWAENGLAGQKWDKNKGRKTYETEPNDNGVRITREMVRQNWNNPSIIFWSSGNETYQEVASHYADVIREEDSSRLITYASAGEKPSNVDFVAGNTYQGWYYNHYRDFSKAGKNAFVSETGAGSWESHHYPYKTVGEGGKGKVWKVDSFEPAEYAQMFAEYRFQSIFRIQPDEHKMFLWWIFRDFYDLKFKKNRNSKGLLTSAGMPKDHYYHFQSFLRPDHPVLHICGRHHFYRQFDADDGIKVYSNSHTVELFVNGESQGVLKNGDYLHPEVWKKGATSPRLPTAVVNNVFFWNATLTPGRNEIEAIDEKGNRQSMVIYQKADAMPVPEDSLVVDLKSSNPENPVLFIDRPVEAQSPFYSEVDGSSDNTFDVIPEIAQGASWITTRRLSDAENKTDLSFKVTRPATVYVMHGTGTYPAHTLDKPNKGVMNSVKGLRALLAREGFEDTYTKGIWRRHHLVLANTGLLKREVTAGETVSIPGMTLDYVVLIKPSK